MMDPSTCASTTLVSSTEPHSATVDSAARAGRPTQRDVQSESSSSDGGGGGGELATGPRKSSLFEAMINSKRAKYCTSTSTQLPSLSSDSEDDKDRVREIGDGTREAVRESQGQSNFDSLAELLEEESTQPDNVSVLAESQCSTIAPTSSCLPESESCGGDTFDLTETRDSFFEDLGAVASEECATLHGSTPQQAEEMRLTGEDDETQVTWGQETEVGDFEEMMDDEFSDFPTSGDESESIGVEREVEMCERQRAQFKQNSKHGAECSRNNEESEAMSQDSISILDRCPRTSHQSQSSKVPCLTALTHPQPISTDNYWPFTDTTLQLSHSTRRQYHRGTSTTLRDSDWEMLGEMLEEDRRPSPPCRHHHQPTTLSHRQHDNRVTDATVPDVVSNCSFSTDIEDSDFHWD